MVQGIEKNLTKPRADFLALTNRKDEINKKIEEAKTSREKNLAELVELKAKIKSDPTLTNT